MFQDTYRAMNRRLMPKEELIRATLVQTASDRTVRPRRSPLRRVALAGMVLTACLCAVPAAPPCGTRPIKCFIKFPPAAAQFFQPVQMRCTDQGITMEVSAVQVEGDTAQAYITFSGGSVDEPRTSLTAGPSTFPSTRREAVNRSPGTRRQEPLHSSAPPKPWTVPLSLSAAK